MAQAKAQAKGPQADDNKAQVQLQRQRPKKATFILRLWAEGDPAQEANWRGQLEYVQSGDKRHFQNLPQLLELLRGQMLGKEKEGGGG